MLFYPMTFLQAIILGTIQGITEFVPISSSGHLIIFPKLMHWPLQSLAFDVVLHIGTLAAVLCYFRRDILMLFKSIIFYTCKEYVAWRKLALFILLSTLPAGFAGLFFNGYIERYARFVPLVLFNLIVWGIVLIIADKYAKKTEIAHKQEPLTPKKVLVIGLMQVFSLLPGTSRSGTTITAGLFTKLSQKDSARFSFLASIPLIAGAGLLKTISLLREPLYDVSVPVLLVGSATAFVTGMCAIAIFMKFLNKRGLTWCGVYRIVLALLLIFIL